MNSLTIRNTTLALSLCLTYLTCSYAEESIESRVSSLESKMGALKTQTAKRTVGAKMATARPLIDGYGFFVTADLLYWQLKEWGTDYAIKTDTAFNGKSQQLRFDWDFGFRIGGGYNFEHDEWDTCLYFTWFQTDGTSHARAPLLSPQIGFPIADVESNRARLHWEVDYYVLDLEVARSFFVSKFLAFRPFFGMETAWIQQDAHLHNHFITSENQHLRGLVVKPKNAFWGIGPRAGIEGTWYFCSAFSLFGGINGALLWGDFDVHDKEKITGTPSTKLTNTSANLHALVPNMKAILGLQWGANFNDNANHIGIKLGYELQYWWRQNQMINIYTNYPLPFYERQSADLSIQGVTLDIRFDF